MMAIRPVYVASPLRVEVDIVEVEFEYFTGFSLKQKQRSIESLHENAQKKGLQTVLEISTKSPDSLGVQLSAFNLSARTKVHDFEFTVERAFQASKVFERGGPYTDLLQSTSLDAKRDPRLRDSGELMYFEFYGRRFGKSPPTFFYDWLYINTLLKNPALCEGISKFRAFSDIEFNPKRSLNCQAYSAALYTSCILNEVEVTRLRDPDFFLSEVQSEYSARWGTEYDNLHGNGTSTLAPTEPREQDLFGET